MKLSKQPSTSNLSNFDASDHNSGMGPNTALSDLKLQTVVSANTNSTNKNKKKKNISAT